jgi:hypothetical protein
MEMVIMKKIIALMLVQLLLTSSAFAISFTFSDQDFLTPAGASWGTMDITAFASDTLQIQYTASTSPPIPSDAEVTGFGFTFDFGTVSAVSNPADGDIANDRNDLNWILYNGDGSTFPGVANGDEFTPAIEKADFMLGVTEGTANNFSPPGILPGETDTYYLAFSDLGGVSLLDVVLSDFVDLTGIRLQSLPDDINEGSLFLAGRPDNGGGGGGDPIPEPSTFILLGAGLAGLAFYRRKKS